MFDRSVKYWLGNLERAYFPKDFFQSAEMQSYVGRIVNERGHEFNQTVAGVFSSAGYTAKIEIQMTELGASKKDGLGDIDVLAWDSASGFVFAVECKRLLIATTVREIVQRLEDFRGRREERDSLGRHLRRIDWLSNHREVLVGYTGIATAHLQLTPLLVTSDIVPMQFYSEMRFPVDQVVPYDDLPNDLAARARGK
jgi:hypothetical protein